MIRTSKILLTRGSFLLWLALAAVLAAPALGDISSAPAPTSPERSRAGISDIGTLLAKIRAMHPQAHILKVELLPGEEGSGHDWQYEVKLFPPNGRILKLTYDARSLQLLESFGGEGGPPRRRLRLRRGWQGGRDE